MAIVSTWSSHTLTDHVDELCCDSFSKKLATIRGNIFNICNRNSILRNNSLIVWLFNWDSNKNFPIKPSHPAPGVSEIRDGEDLWQWSQLEIRLNAFHHNHTTKTIHHHHHHDHFFVLILSRFDFDDDLIEAICLSILQ